MANNLMTVGVLSCLAKRGLANLGLVGFDELPWADVLRPRLTTITQPTYEIGQTAAELLLDRIAAPARPPAEVTLATTLEVRDSSVRPPPAQSTSG